MTAGRHGPSEVFVLVDGYDLTANKLTQLNHAEMGPQIETLGLGDSWKERTPLGTRDVEVTQDGGLFDTATGRSHEALSASVPSSVQAVPRIMNWAYAGQAIGDPFYGIEGAYTQSYQVAAKNDDLQRANAKYAASGQLDEGRILQPLAQQSADWDTEASSVDNVGDTAQRVVPITSSSVANPSVITTPVPHGISNGQKVFIAGHSGSTPDINGEQTATVTSPTTFTIPVNVTVGGTGGTVVPADSLNGGVAYLQVTEFTGFTGFVGTVMDSPDDIVYSSLVAFDNVTSAPAAQRKTVSGTVDRYLAFDGNVTGTGTITAFAGFARL